MKNIERVREFHETYSCFINETEGLKNVDKKLALQRFNLITEELHELVNAWVMEDRVEILDALTDLEYVLDGTFLTFGTEFDTSHPEYEKVKNVVLDELPIHMNEEISLPFFMNMSVYGMLDYYLAGEYEDVALTLMSMRVLVDVMFDVTGLEAVREAAAIEVHKSNMSKLGEDGKPIVRESDGKILKGPDYFQPNLGQFIDVDNERRNTGIR